ncbi:hypothetical protein E4U31_006058 [Claviceps sp. LM219 group G6]|nr:hypothetical protein E4U31_006058 [Claviceps sp. LM219 group G6]KAG6106541.1 hypothetical protein E4U14_004530 [Claviceps sp. LM454 group G7]
MEYHELDPNGDKILTLRPQNLQPFPGLFGRGDLDSARFRLSSKHLIRASPVFRAMITGPWKESLAFAAAPVAKHSAGIPDEDALPENTATEWDKETFLLLLEILHGRYEPLKDPLPDVDACMLVKMCVMVDNYQCHKAVQGFVDAWIKCIIDTVPLSYG